MLKGTVRCQAAGPSSLMLSLQRVQGGAAAMWGVVRVASPVVVVAL